METFRAGPRIGMGGAIGRAFGTYGRWVPHTILTNYTPISCPDISRKLMLNMILPTAMYGHMQTDVK
jgi:hypothetical protein